MTFFVSFLFAFAIILLVIGAMAIGVLGGRPPIRGSCGGLNGKPCELCSGTCIEETRE
jgi:uncharacterized protein